MGGVPNERKRYILFQFGEDRGLSRKDFIDVLNGEVNRRGLREYKVWLTVYEPPYAIVRCLHTGQKEVTEALNSMQNVETLKTSGTIITLKEILRKRGVKVG